MTANILIVDDYADNRELLRLMLEGLGHKVCEAEDGHVGLEMARAEIPDLILVDLSMPRLDGWGLLKEFLAWPSRLLLAGNAKARSRRASTAICQNLFAGRNWLKRSNACSREVKAERMATTKGKPFD
jgi:CheY-like chemotaxis protein